MTTEYDLGNLLSYRAEKVLARIKVILSKGGASFGSSQVWLDDNWHETKVVHVSLEHNMGNQRFTWDEVVDRDANLMLVQYDYNDGHYDWASKTYTPPCCYVQMKV